VGLVVDHFDVSRFAVFCEREKELQTNEPP
jgi:hypothetical protein